MNISTHIYGLFFLLLFPLLLCSTTLAAPADTDTDFGQYGIALAEFPQHAVGKVVLIQSDNKIVVAGTVFNSTNTTNHDFAVVRFNTDGSLDTSFGTNGLVITSILGLDTAETGILQPDGKILIGGGAGNKFGLARYKQDGSLDTTFGDGGKVVTDFGSSGGIIHTILIQPDGKIVAVGEYNGLDNRLARYHADGSLDESFGMGGRVSTRYVAEGNSSNSALLQMDGKILVGGNINTNESAANFALFRYNTNGTLDLSFDGDGVATAALSTSHDRIRKLLFRPDGKILVVGSAGNAKANTLDYAFGVYNSNGTPDSSFGNNGFFIVPATGHTEIEDAILQADGKIVVSGTKIPGNYPRFHIARFNADGTFDLTFGNGGKTNPPIGKISFGYSIALQPDNKILIAGGGTSINDNKRKIAVTRLEGGTGAIPATATITGRVLNDLTGKGVGRVQVILTGGTGTPLYARTNPFGFYRFTNLPVNTEYSLIIRLKRVPVFQSSLQILLKGNEYAEDLHFRY